MDGRLANGGPPIDSLYIFPIRDMPTRAIPNQYPLVTTLTELNIARTRK